MEIEPAQGRPASVELRDEVLSTVVRACDVVFGTMCTGLAAVGTVLLVAGKCGLLTVVALWAVPVFNLVWSALSRGWNRVRADLLRAGASLPITAFLYAAEPGVLVRLWLPTLVVTIGVVLSISIATRRPALGYLVSVVNGAALLAAGPLRGHAFDARSVSHATGILVAGFVMAIVGGKLGAVIEEARCQRDDARWQQQRAEAALGQLTERTGELTTANQTLREEMAHRARMELELRQAQKLESVRRLAAGVAHEINTPVQFVSDSIHFLQDASKDLLAVVEKLREVKRFVLQGQPAEAAAHQADAAEESADLPYLIENMPQAYVRSLDGLDRVATIVRSLKEFAHPDAQEMSSIDLNHAIESTLIMARNEYKYVADVETDLAALPPVRCHAGDVNQAVLNIVVNAAHAVGDVVRGTDRKGRITVRTRVDGDDVVIAIGDTGGGIPDAIRERIFDPFFTTKAVGRGTGQGLSIARKVITEKHGGSLTLESTLGAGTTFFIRLPIEHREPDAVRLAG